MLLTTERLLYQVYKEMLIDTYDVMFYNAV
jgi:hypothetical protein